MARCGRGMPTSTARRRDRVTFLAATYTRGVSAIDPAAEPVGLTVLPPEDALRSAKPAPADNDLVIEGLTDAEWGAFETALTDR